MPDTVAHDDVVCPFCALLCDDLVVEADGSRLKVTANGCPRAQAGFARRAPASVSPMVGGRPVSLGEAVDRAGEILRRANLPLLAGLGTDTAGMRAAIRLAEAVGGVLDHAHGSGLLANLAAMQGGGWVTATLAKARNRPDFVLLVGGDGSAVSSRLHERVLRPPKTLDSAGPPGRRIVQLGGKPSAWPRIEHVACPPEGLLAAVGMVRALVAGRRVDSPDGQLGHIAEALRGARYALIVWTAGLLPEPEATVTHLAEITKTLNAKGRAAGLPLSAPDNVIGANQVATWQTGVPLPLGLVAGVPEHEPRRWSAAALLARGAADALLWVASLGDLEPPETPAPTIVLARAGFVPKRPVEVLIPVGTPGLDHAGSLYRSDGVVALPVRGLRAPVAPGVAEVVAALVAAV